MVNLNQSLLCASSKSAIIECIKSVKKDLTSYYKCIDKNFTKLSMNFEQDEKTKRSFDDWLYDDHEGIDQFTIEHVIDAMQVLKTFNNEKLANSIMECLNEYYFVQSKDHQVINTNEYGLEGNCQLEINKKDKKYCLAYVSQDNKEKTTLCAGSRKGLQFLFRSPEEINTLIECGKERLEEQSNYGMLYYLTDGDSSQYDDYSNFYKEHEIDVESY